MPRFNGVELTAETIARTRQHFADISFACIAAAESGATRVNDLESYVAWHVQEAANSLAGLCDYSLTFLQRAHWLQTGESVALLPK